MPYQLHCCPLTALLTTELLVTASDDELLALLAGIEEAGVELGTEDLAPPQILPVIVGRSALPPRFSTWKPNCTLCPGCIVPFQLTLLAV